MTRPKLGVLAKRKLSAARAAIEEDMRVVALQPKSKAPDTRYCPKGADSAVQDIGVVREWLVDDPSINLGAVVKGSPVLVVDVDGPEGEGALKRFGSLPETRETITRNGRHLYFRHDGKVSGSKIKFEPELDIIASGYVLLPFSTHPDGGRYHSDEVAAPIAQLPKNLSKAISERSKSAVAGRSDGGGVITKGQRDNRLASLAGSFRRQGFDADVIATALHAVNGDHCSPPLPEKDIDRIVRSIAGKDPADHDLFESMGNVTPRDVDFLWEPYFVRGAINLLEGDPNVGKTYLLCEIAAAISSGRPLPGQAKAKAANVLFMSAEDDPETTLVRRLMRMDADLDRITFSKKFFRLEEEALGWIEKHIAAQKAAVLILDPLLAYMQGGIDMNKANETRPFMARLTVASFEPEEVDLAAVLTEAADELWPLSSRRNVRILIDDAGEPHFLSGERHALGRALVNLLDNAVKFSPAGGQISCRVRTMGEIIECIIEDEGPGIPPERRQRLFARYGHSRPVGSQQSAGLGLAYVRTAVERHGGSVMCEACTPHGTRFILRFPAMETGS